MCYKKANSKYNTKKTQLQKKSFFIHIYAFGKCFIVHSRYTFYPHQTHCPWCCYRHALLKLWFKPVKVLCCQNQHVVCIPFYFHNVISEWNRILFQNDFWWTIIKTFTIRPGACKEVNGVHFDFILTTRGSPLLTLPIRSHLHQLCQHYKSDSWCEHNHCCSNRMDRHSCVIMLLVY